MNDMFRHLHFDPSLACEFLAVFSRMEYALKASGAYAMDGGGGKAAGNWDKFANAIDKTFCAIADAELKSAVHYLLSNAPRKQIFQDGGVLFVDQTIDKKQTTTQQTLLMVRTVRNNLFHGGKHIPGLEMEPGRNHALVSHSLNVLKHCIGLDESVRQAYEI